MAGGPRVEVVVDLWEHECNCDMCEYSELNMEITAYFAVCCYSLPSRSMRSIEARMALSEHLSQEHGIVKDWQEIPWQEPIKCKACEGGSALGYSTCSACDNRGWVVKE